MSRPASTIPLPTASSDEPSAVLSSWNYAAAAGKRELRIDFLRGFIMLIVITVHMDYYSLYSFVVWERLGIISSAEGFVALSGMVLGMVYCRKVAEDGWNKCAARMFDRSFQLYRINLGVVFVVYGLNLLPFVDAFEVMNYVTPSGDKVYPLYPPSDAGMKALIGNALLLKSGPHQFQVMGLYVILLAAAPFIFWCPLHGRTRLILAISWVLYLINWARPGRPTGAQFEYAFPLLTWQLLFVHGLVLGVHKDAIVAFFRGFRAHVLMGCAVVFAFMFWMLTMNNPNPMLPDWARFEFITAGDFYRLRGEWFGKSTLGLGRLVNNAALFVMALGLLTVLWRPINRALGWLLIPLGQASLYVFIVHVFFVLAASLTPWHEMNNFWLNTLMHSIAILGIWAMVKTRFLFKWVPR